MRPVRRIASLSVLLLLAATAQGQSWPSKPIRVVVPQAPGGGSDLVARLMSPEIEAPGPALRDREQARRQ